MQSTMKIFCAVLLSFLLLKVASAFTAGGPTLVFSRNRLQTAVAALKETAAEAYLTQCLDEWDLLEKELVNLKAHAKVSKDENVSYKYCVYSYCSFFGESVIDHHNTHNNNTNNYIM